MTAAAHQATATPVEAQPRDRNLLVYFTATIITLTGGNLAEGEPCEPDCGYTITQGHWNPRRTYWTVHPTRDEVTPDRCPARRRKEPAEWLASRIHARLGLLDHYDGGHTFYSRLEAIHPHRLTGRSSHQPGAVIGSGTFAGDIIAAERLRSARSGQRTITAAAHAYGFTASELRTAAELLEQHSAPINPLRAPIRPPRGTGSRALPFEEKGST